MKLVRSIMPLVRRFASNFRRRTTRVAKIATQFNRVVVYGFDLVLWSRIFAGRRGVIPLGLPPSLLERKSIHRPPPFLHVSGVPETTHYFGEAFAAMNALLFANLQNPDILSKLRYAHPGPAFRGVYLWDSAFIAQIWKHWDRSVACEILEAVVELRDGDRFQHVVADFVQSAFTQPPLIAWSATNIFRGNSFEADVEFLRRIYEPLKRYNAWLYENRVLPNGLFAWAHPYESGVENSPRFATRDESELRDTRGTAAPDFSAYVVLQNEAIARIAGWLENESDVRDYTRKAELLREQVNAYLWHEEQGLYFDRDTSGDVFVPSRTIASLLPLWAGIPDSERAKRLMEHVLDPEQFSSEIPLPSVAVSDTDFEKDMWRGPVWINTAYGVLCGVRRYGFLQEAADLAFRLCDGVYHVFDQQRRVYEFYDPHEHNTVELDRKRGNRWKALTLGKAPQTEFVGWTGLVNTIVIEFLFGFRWEEGKRLVQPCFPKECAGLGFSLRLPAEEISIDFDIFEHDHYRGAVRRLDGTREFDARFGDVIDIDELFEHPADRYPEPVSSDALR